MEAFGRPNLTWIKLQKKAGTESWSYLVVLVVKCMLEDASSQPAFLFLILYVPLTDTYYLISLFIGVYNINVYLMKCVGEYSRIEKCIQGCKANGKIQAGCSRSKLCERCKWKSVGRK